MNFHPLDPNLIINALRLLLEGLTKLRTEKGREEPDKRETVLRETVERAEEMSAKGSGAEQVVLEIETKLEQGLGTAAKDEIVQRASSILALAQPFEVEAFEYYKTLLLVLERATIFCHETNIFKLRGTHDGQLVLPSVSSEVAAIFGNFKMITDQLMRGEVFGVRLVTLGVYLPDLRIKLRLEVEKAYSVGGSYKERFDTQLFLAQGTSVNQIKVIANTYAMREVQFRLTAKDVEEIVSALLSDINNYVKDLADEQRDFKEKIAPQLEKLVNQWPKLSDKN